MVKKVTNYYIEKTYREKYNEEPRFCDVCGRLIRHNTNSCSICRHKKFTKKCGNCQRKFLVSYERRNEKYCPDCKHNYDFSKICQYPGCNKPLTKYYSTTGFCIKHWHMGKKSSHKEFVGITEV